MENKPSEEGSKGSKINQNILIAIIGAIATIVATIIPWALNRYNTGPAPTPILLVITATSAPVFPTETVFVSPTETATEAFTFTPTVELPTATATLQEGIFDGFLASDIDGFIPKSQFKPAEIIYLLFNINDPTGKSVVRIVWSVVDVKGTRAGTVKSDTPYIIRTQEFVTLSNHSADPWRVGKYKVELYLNNDLKQTIEFDIVE